MFPGIKNQKFTVVLAFITKYIKSYNSVAIYISTSIISAN